MKHFDVWYIWEKGKISNFVKFNIVLNILKNHN